MFGRLVAGLLVVGLAIGVWALWPRDPEPSQTTLPEAADTTITTPSDTTTTVAPTSPTTTTEAGVVTTVQEAEQILREFWFGWFEGIYNEDEERIREVVASQSQLDAAVEAFGEMTFIQAPMIQGVRLFDVTILRSDNDCLVINAELDVTEFRGEGATTQGVHVLRSTEAGWKSVSTWNDVDDLWSQDCDSQLEPLSS